ncbi:carbohydrate ABC transporter permease [Acholeplasma granularum]|uniref:carbohydrate ABC transporter permease n=1 Tax=Acholeplasma granularum TaxID=264635 RepID=UPI0004715CE0|nr:carbohydrate ABC transporter permease [Acholeplasma granularum]
MERMNRSEIVFKIIAYILIGVFAAVALYPLIYAVSASISSRAPYESGQVVLFPVDVNFDVYKILFTRNAFWITYTNTLFYTVFGTIWSMFVSVTGAYALAKKRLHFRRQFNFFVVFTMWFSAGMIPSYLNYVEMGVDNRWGMVFAFGVQAFNIILLRNYFESVPSEIEEAARIDGASEFQMLSSIYLPMSKAALATVTLFYATSRWNGYFWASILLKNSQEKPLQVFLREEMQSYQTLLDNMLGADTLAFSPDSYAYAILICSIIPILIIYPFIQKYFARGVNMGGVKG